MSMVTLQNDFNGGEKILLSVFFLKINRKGGGVEGYTMMRLSTIRNKTILGNHQRRGFLHFLLFKQKVKSPLLLNPWRDIPEWQKYLRRKAVENPKYHQRFLDEVNPEVQREGNKTQMFVLVAVLVFLVCYDTVLGIRCRSLQVDIEDIQFKYIDLNRGLKLADQNFSTKIIEALDEVMKGNSDRQRGKIFKQVFDGLI